MYEPNKMCKRFVDVDKLREVEGQTFKSVMALEKAIGWIPYNGILQKKCDIKRLSYYCELQFDEYSRRVTVIRVF